MDLSISYLKYICTLKEWCAHVFDNDDDDDDDHNHEEEIRMNYNFFVYSSHNVGMKYTHKR